MSTVFHAYIQAAAKEQFEDLALSFALDLMQPDATAKLRLQTANHPDFLRIYPDNANIKIGQVRECLFTLSVCPYEGGQRVVVFIEAESMTAQAQNCLLKTLEDPPGDTTFLLLCERPLMLLPTIRSRCMMLAAPKSLRDDTTALVDELLEKLKTAQNVLDVAAKLPQDRGALIAHCTLLLDGLDRLIQRAALKDDASLISLSKCVMHVNKSQSMLERNVSTALCAQWLCIHIKEEFYDYRGRRQV